MHDVDEDLTAILCQGGCFAYDGNTAGVVYRHLFDVHGRTVNTVASKKNNIQPPSFTRRLCNVLYYNFTILIILWISVA